MVTWEDAISRSTEGKQQVFLNLPRRHWEHEQRKHQAVLFLFCSGVGLKKRHTLPLGPCAPCSTIDGSGQPVFRNFDRCTRTITLFLQSSQRPIASRLFSLKPLHLSCFNFSSHPPNPSLLSLPELCRQIHTDPPCTQSDPLLLTHTHARIVSLNQCRVHSLRLHILHELFRLCDLTCFVCHGGVGERGPYAFL